MRLVVGLGNPGLRYRGTRHNIGFEVLEELASRWGASTPRRKRFHGEVAEAVIPDAGKVILLWPHTYMNRSGLSVGEAVRWYGIDPGVDLLVVCDDLNLPLGSLRLRPRGSDGGQKGLRDIIRALGTENFPRLRCGVGPLPPGITATDFVLGKFLPEEQPLVRDMVKRAASCVDLWVREGINRAMTTYNVRPGRTGSSGDQGNRQSREEHQA